MPALIASRFASVCCAGGRWVTESPYSIGLGRELLLSDAALLVIARLLQFCGTPKRFDEIASSSSRFGLSPEECVEMIDVAQSLGFLVPVERQSVWEDDRGPATPELASYLAARESVRFLPAGEAEIAEDSRRMALRAIEEPPPPSMNPRARSTERNFWLAHPAVTRPTSAQSCLGHLLFWGLGRLREARFLGHLPAILKVTPSNGARHPIDAYVISPGSRVIGRGAFKYDVDLHRLCLLDSDVRVTSETVLVLTAVFERVQWRYRHSWNYKDLFCDLGHVVANLKAAADYLGIRIACSLEKADLRDLEIPLIEESVYAIVLDLNEDEASP